MDTIQTIAETNKERLATLKQYLAHEKKLKHPDNRYIEDLEISIKRLQRIA